MAAGGSGYDWKVYPVTTGSGYEINMYRLTKDETGAYLPGTRGPIMLTSGVYSDIEDWLSVKDATVPSKAVQFAQMGYDVWFGNQRGREGSKGHTTLNMDLAADMATYADFSFDQIGTEDYPVMIDTILANSYVGESCGKVTMATHSSGSNSAMIMANMPGMADKVDRIITVAPCLLINYTDYWLPVNDITSVDFIYDLFEDAGVNSLFGPGNSAELDAFCTASQMNSDICGAFLTEPYNNPDIKEECIKHLKHLSQNTSVNKFMPFIDNLEFDPVTGEVLTPPEYPVGDINGIQVFSIFGMEDTYCP